MTITSAYLNNVQYPHSKLIKSIFMYYIAKKTQPVLLLSNYSDTNHLGFSFLVSHYNMNLIVTTFASHKCQFLIFTLYEPKKWICKIYPENIESSSQ